MPPPGDQPAELADTGPLRAVRFDRYGTADVIGIAPISVAAPGPEQVQIRTMTSGVNFAEVMFRRGQIEVGLPHVPGLEAIGIVTAVGEGVAEFAIGDRVAAMTLAGGGQAEVVVADAAFTVALAGALADLDPVLAAAVLCNGTTALGAIEVAGRPVDGDTVLVTAASGGVGGALIDLLSGRDLRVVAASSDAGRLAPAVRDKVAAVTAYGGLGELGPYDVVFDTVGGSVRRGIRDHLRVGARHVVMGDAAQDDLVVSCDSVWMSSTALVGHNLGAVGYADGALFRDHMRRVLEMAAAGILDPAVTVVDPSAVADVHRLLESRTSSGKYVIDWRR